VMSSPMFMLSPTLRVSISMDFSLITLGHMFQTGQVSDVCSLLSASLWLPLLGRIEASINSLSGIQVCDTSFALFKPTFMTARIDSE
jgi:hypothetical protein